jgi:murein DD-endopeptidase MepM/ murein hydrolase activator NlpD
MRRGGLLTRLSAVLRKSFPERQIYIRSTGNVQFFTFGPSLQAWLAGLVMILMAWVGFATVCVIFKDRSIAALDDRYEQARAAYAGRLSDLQESYDDLGAALAQSARRFHLAVGRLADKQKLVGELLAQDSRVEGIASAPDVASAGVEGQPYGDNFTPAYTLAASRPLADQDDDLGPHPKPYLAINWAGVHALAGTLASRVRLAASHLVSNGGLRRQTSRVQNPALIVLERQGERVRLLDASETLLLRQAEGVFDQHTERLHGIIRRTGIDPNQFMEKVASADAVGGPEISLDQVQILGIADPGFTHAYLLAQAVLDRLATLSSAMRHIPLDMPVSAARFDRTSGFGPRRDPFTGRFAFHPGLDFGGPWGASVVATAPGIVVFAGDDGSYGTAVEIDHGMGFHTRYAHLSALAVRKGMTVKKDAMIGRVGSTGRSTGPHVHYEIWYDNRVRNPALFLSNGGHGFSGSSGSSAESVSATARDND